MHCALGAAGNSIRSNRARLRFSPRWVGLGSAILLFLFGTAMAISFGIKPPLDYSVFSASAGALLLSLFQARKSAVNS